MVKSLSRLADLNKLCIILDLVYLKLILEITRHLACIDRILNYSRLFLNSLLTKLLGIEVFIVDEPEEFDTVANERLLSAQFVLTFICDAQPIFWLANEVTWYEHNVKIVDVTDLAHAHMHVFLLPVYAVEAAILAITNFIVTFGMIFNDWIKLGIVSLRTFRNWIDLLLSKFIFGIYLEMAGYELCITRIYFSFPVELSFDGEGKAKVDAVKFDLVSGLKVIEDHILTNVRI